MEEPSLPLTTRLWFALVCLVRVLTDARFAGRAFLVRDALPEPPAPEPAPAPPSPVAVAPVAPPVDEGALVERGALQLLALLQRESRLVDFLEEDTAGVGDADLGAAVRQIHRDCQRALRGCVSLAPVRTEAEGQPITVPSGYDASEIKLTGNLKGKGPYQGALRHRGWRAQKVTLPTLLPGVDPRVLAAAEVELLKQEARGHRPERPAAFCHGL